ncbi:MAG: hypothetical protein A3H76_04905 [Candidatus Lloydbacteria bacterium RIFCSPLOWO2_02_FULL_54_12]|nr:MAG: hypothetical protein A3H76_04905 [Candidatus Lloydbacteria bacterium RIFCSPLOWO2_02_FULL_54_12]
MNATTLAGGGGGDTTAPTTPTGLGAASMSSSQINLSWTASTDNVGVAGYKIYRNGTYLLTVTSPNYSNTGLSPSTNYSYYVKAIDAAGNESTSSNTANSTTLSGGGGDTADTQSPTTPTGLVATKDVHNEVDLSWTASTDNVGVSMYHVLRSQSGVWSYIGQSTNTTYIDLTVTPSTSYYYAVKAYDAAGYYSATSTPLFLNTPAAPTGGTTYPPSPTMPTAYFVPNGSYGSSTNIMWTDVSNETSYKVYERVQGSGSGSWVLAKIRTSPDGLVDAIYAANTVSVQVRAYLFGTYEYKVSACNSYGCSDSPSVSVTMGGTTTTTTTTNEWTQIAPSYLRLGGTPSISGIPLAWNDNSTNEDKFNLERQISGGNFVGAFLVQLGANATSHTDTTAVSGVYYDYRVQACRSGGGCTDFAYLSGVGTSGMVSTTTTTGSVPTAPSSLRLIPPPSPPQIAFAWNDNSTNEDKWNIERSVAGMYYWTAITQITTANVVSYTDSTPVRGTYYDYRVQACRSGYGCSPSAYLYGVATPETAGTPTGIASTTTSGSASVSVIRGISFCDGSLGKTPFTLSVMPYGAAFFKVIMTLPNPVSTIVAPGTYSLPNGSYRWEAVAYTGYTLSGKTSENFVLDQYCSGTTSTTTTTTINPEIATTITEQPPTQTFKPYILLNGDAFVRVPYGGTYDEKGARGYLTPEGSAIAPKRLLGGLDTKVPGSYTITYQLLSPTTGIVVASLTRTVIVEPMPIVQTSSDTTLFTGTTIQPPPTAPSVDMITTVEQYEHYCDDPAHALECQSYANQKIVVSVTNATAPVVVGISQEAFDNVPVGEVFQEVSLPSTITDATQLNAVCAQSEYVNTCTKFLVDQGVLSKEEAASQVRQVFAQAEDVTKIFAERIGARAFEDTDNDTITNYDEVNIYKTDPNKADTNGDGVKDGEQLLLGQDPAAPKAPPAPLAPSAFPTSTAPVAPVIIVPEKKTAYEDPRFAGNVKKEIFTAGTVKAEPIAPPAGAPEDTAKSKITLGGKALPNSFVTIYIFSEPIVVTIKTDAAGAWTYTLDKELPDGTHEVYSAITDAGGRILAKSEPLPFVKTAAAVSLGSAILLPPENQEPGFFSGTSLYALIFIMVGVIGLGVSVMGFIASRRKEGGGGSPPAASA